MNQSGNKPTPAGARTSESASLQGSRQEHADSAVRAPNRREFVRNISLAGAAAGLGGVGVLAQPTPAPQRDKALIAITLDLEMARNFPKWEDSHWDYEKGNLNDDAKRYAYAARAGIATADNKAKYWSDFTANKDISESWIEAAFGPFNSVRHSDLTLPYLERALAELPNHKRTRKIFFVNGWLGAFIGGQKNEAALTIVNKFLTDNPNLDRDLRLKILENVDLIERAVKIRSKFK
ncbi:MAG: twin-arginine translocation signal domain-containing protein [Pyrinomonadaceae bacterium]